MVRITDILKIERDREDEERKKINKSSAGAGGADAPKKQEVKISSAFANENKQPSDEECVQIYNDLLACAKATFRDGIEHHLIDIKQIKELVEKLVVQLGIENEKILSLAFTEDSSQTNYLFCHAINTCVYSIQIGIGAGYSRAELVDLGVSAFFHNIGMVKYISIFNQKRQLTDDEYKEIKNHIKIGFELLEKVKDLPNSAIRVALEHHERIDGSGYPNGITGESINGYAKIVGLVDSFNAMVHDMPYRKKKLPVDAVKEILSVKKAYEYNAIKLLLNRIGVYPVGSFVQLNTNEIAQVVKLNYDVPLRPVVSILPYEGAQPAKEIKILDLSAQPTIFIKSAKFI